MQRITKARDTCFSPVRILFHTWRSRWLTDCIYCEYTTAYLPRPGDRRAYSSPEKTRHRAARRTPAAAQRSTEPSPADRYGSTLRAAFPTDLSRRVIPPPGGIATFRRTASCTERVALRVSGRRAAFDRDS